MLVIETLIRHASPSGTVTAISGGMHGATTRSCLIASPSFPLVVAPGFLRAGSDAVDLTSIAPPTDEDLRAAASTQKHPAIRFIGRVRHTNPPDRRRFRPPSAPIRSSMPTCSKLSRRGLETSECASMAERRPTLTASARAGVRNLRSGRKKACGAVKQKKDDEVKKTAGMLLGRRAQPPKAMPPKNCGFRPAFTACEWRGVTVSLGQRMASTARA